MQGGVSMQVALQVVRRWFRGEGACTGLLGVMRGARSGRTGGPRLACWGQARKHAVNFQLPCKSSAVGLAGGMQHGKWGHSACKGRAGAFRWLYCIVACGGGAVSCRRHVGRPVGAVGRLRGWACLEAV